MNPTPSTFRNDRSRPPLREHGFALRPNDWPLDRVAHERYVKLIIDQLVVRPAPVSASALRWIDYIRSLSKGNLVATTVEHATDLLWRQLCQSLPSIYPPDASPTEDGTLLMSWLRDEHHFEIEVMPSERYVWFYRNHELNRDYIGEGSPSEALTPEFMERARAVFV
jgi:hypothetical protein